MKRNLFNTPKFILEESEVTAKVGELKVSELKNIKGFGDNTIIKLNENGITSIQQLKKLVDEADGEFTKLTHILTGIQQQQFKNYLKQNPLLVEDV